MKRKNYAILLFCFIITVNVNAAGPGTYYNSIDTNQSCSQLKTLLFNLISSNTTVITYSQVDNFYSTTDSKPSEFGAGEEIVDRYCAENPIGLDYCNFTYGTSFCSGALPGSDTNQCVCYNKEHVFPKSWFGTIVYPMYSDMHYVWPADNRINLFKSNYPIGYAKNVYFTSRNGSTVGQSDGTKNFGYTSSNVFEPIDAFKGDFARAYLYVVTRYEDSISGWVGRSTSGNVLSGNKYPGYDSWILQLCVKWSKMDPPSLFEQQRNDAVQSIQGNRNPYIDHPNWVEKVFGVNGISSSCVSTGIINKKNDDDFSLYPNPAQHILYVKYKNKIADQSAYIEVMNILGSKIKSQEVTTEELQLIDISNFPEGAYFINLIYNGSGHVATFIKK
ncbi:MAG: endonuclease [Bacteroidota bacterium]|nr:endonuclease [Bacteroidota bacterium]